MHATHDADLEKLLPRKHSRAGVVSCVLFGFAALSYGVAAIIIYVHGTPVSPDPLMPQYGEAFAIAITLFAGLALGFSSNLMGFALALMALGQKGVKKACALWGVVLNGATLSGLTVVYLVGRFTG